MNTKQELQNQINDLITHFDKTREIINELTKVQLKQTETPKNLDLSFLENYGYQKGDSIDDTLGYIYEFENEWLSVDKSTRYRFWQSLGGPNVCVEAIVETDGQNNPYVSEMNIIGSWGGTVIEKAVEIDSPLWQEIEHQIEYY